MNRTNEFNKIVQTTNIPQKTVNKVKSTLIDLFENEKLIKNKILELLKCQYEMYNVRNKINEIQKMCQNLLDELKAFHSEYSNSQEEEVYEKIYNLLKGRVSEYKLEVISYLRKIENKEKINKERRNKFVHMEDKSPIPSFTQTSQQQEILIEENSVRLRNQEINQQISEIGNLMEEIGIHVSLQEENFKRIDDLMEQSDKFLDSSIYILKRGIEGITSTRKSIIKFFMFWIVLVIIFWLFRK